MLKPSIRTKLFVGFFSILGLVVIIFLFSFFQYKRLAGITDSLYNHPLKVSNAIREVDMNLIRLHHSIINIAIADSEEALSIAIVIADSSILSIIENFNIVYERFLGEKSLVDSAFRGFEKMQELKMQIVNIREKQGNDEAIVFSRKNLSDNLKSTVVHTKAIADFASDKADSFLLESREKIKYYQNRMVWISIFLIITGVIIAIRISNRISKPILNFARETFLLMHGENVKIPTNPSEETLLSIITDELKSNYEKLRTELIKKEIAEKTIREQYEKINDYSKELFILNEDLEERAKLKAQELFKSERNFKQLFNGINDAVFVYEMVNGQLGCIQEFNEAGERLLGYSAEELREMKITDLLGENSAKDFTEMIKLRKEEESEFTMDLYYLSNNGERIPVELSTHVFIMGDSEKFLSIGRNISERIAREIQLKELNEEIVKQNEEYQSINEEYISINEELTQTIEELSNTNIKLEEAKEKAEQSERLKSAFLANMSHEIRTPMNGIMGFADLINGENVSQEQRNRFAGIILKSSKQLLQILNDILDMSRIEANEVKLVVRPVNVNELLNELFIFFSNDKGLKGIEFKLIKSLNDSSAGILSDETRLRQVLTNLLNNAFKFTDAGQITFGYELINGHELEFFVKDSGIGIPYNKQALIFERFSQAEDSINSRYGGTGLGLSISKGLVKLLGGNIRIESEEGMGSTFYFTIPYREVMKNKKEKQNDTLAKYNWEGKTILIVEDDPVGREYLSEILKSTGVTTIYAESGEEGLEIVSTNGEISLILMDIRLPGISGIETCIQIKTLHKDVPIIAQTANAFTTDEVECYEAGCNGFISKPIEKDNLLQYVASFLDN